VNNHHVSPIELVLKPSAGLWTRNNQDVPRKDARHLSMEPAFDALDIKLDTGSQLDT
jgi:hypothetical protein